MTVHHVSRLFVRQDLTNLSHAARKSWRAKFQKVAFRPLDGFMRSDRAPGLVGDRTGIMPSFSAMSNRDFVPLRCRAQAVLALSRNSYTHRIEAAANVSSAWLEEVARDKRRLLFPGVLGVLWGEAVLPCGLKVSSAAVIGVNGTPS